MNWNGTKRNATSLLQASNVRKCNGKWNESSTAVFAAEQSGKKRIRRQIFISTGLIGRKRKPYGGLNFSSQTDAISL